MGVLRVLQTCGVKHLHSFVLSCDVTIGEIVAVVGADVAITAAGERGEITDVGGLVFGDVADTMAFTGDYLDGVLVVGVGRVWFQGGSELAEVFINVFAMCDTCNGKFEIVTYSLNFWPYADVVAFVLDTEILEFLDWRIRITATNYYFHLRCANRVAIVVKEIEMAWLIGGWRLFRRCRF